MYILGEKLKDICDLFLNHWNFKHNAPLGASHNERSEAGGVILKKRSFLREPRCRGITTTPEPRRGSLKFIH